MPKYTTGELAGLTGVTVRTVQYYDERGILIPSELSEGGRRLYTEDDLKKLTIICFLRDAGLSIGNIAAILAEKNPKNIISIILDEQERELRGELSECEAKLDIIEGIKRALKSDENFSVESIGDIANIMKQKNKLKKMRWMMILSGIPLAVLEWSSIAVWIALGAPWLFLGWLCAIIPWGVLVSRYYFRHVAYICPECHEKFRPPFTEAFRAYHTPRTRRLKCPHCGKKCLCVEVYHDYKNDKSAIAK